MKRKNIVKSIQEKAYQLGYEKCGIIPLDRMDGFEEKFAERIEKIPASQPFYENQRRLLEFREKYPWAKSVIVLNLPFNHYRVPESLTHRVARSYLFDNRMNPQSAEYQSSMAMGEYLQSLGLRVDCNRNFGAVGMRWAAMEAGVGLVRKNNFLYTESGSWVHLEGFLIDQELELIEKTDIPVCPPGCSRCVEACPTRALQGPYLLQPMACISFLTTFGGRSLTDQTIWKQFGSCIYGCDICQEVCPMNKGKAQGTTDFPGLTELEPLLNPAYILAMTEKEYQEKIQPKFFYLRPDELWKWQVNVLWFMVNNGVEKYKEVLVAACSHEQEKVRALAQAMCGEFF
ncbi:epoxyqueuosine reductase [Aminipila butyrica]|uniref:Epoxyqueuosine reductase n=1 Tax=Aminipila butyrica TaxID=433296 RepID=A0A858BU06_9FIRM|nr:epoxyqueuosine reductase [Aminipila butyrica]QIB68822.1 epoxyqueuosine reductase [Aminipila butyrica]